MNPVDPRASWFAPPEPTFTKVPKALKRDILTEYDKQVKREKKLHSSWLSWAVDHTPLAPQIILWLLRASLSEDMKLNDVQRLKVPKWLPLHIKKAYARILATFIAEKLKSAEINTLADLSTVQFPDVYCSSLATETVRSALEAKMNTFLPADEITLGAYGSEISPLFIDVFNRAQPDHTQLTIDAPCDLTRLIQSLTKPSALHLSTALHKELKTIDVQHLIDRTNITAVTIKRPYPMALTASLPKKTWKRLDPWLSQESLEVKLEPRVKEPREEYAWLKRFKALKLRFVEATD